MVFGMLDYQARDSRGWGFKPLMGRNEYNDCTPWVGRSGFNKNDWSPTLMC